MSDADEMARVAADFHLSERGANATKPPFSYLHAFFRAAAEPYDPEARPDGYVNLAVAQNFLTVDTVQARLRAAMATEQPASTAGYDNMRGSDRLRAALASHMRRVLAPDAPADAVHPDQLCVSAGCGAIIDNLFLAITSPGDGVLIPAPYYPAFDNDLRVRNGTVAVPVHGDAADALPSPTTLDRAFAASAERGAPVRAVLLTNPSNPLGVVYPLDDVLTVARWALDRGLHVVVDEVYASSAFDAGEGEGAGARFVSALRFEDALGDAAKTRLHVVYGLSKDFCASGYRVGVLRTHNEGIIRAMDNVAYFCTLPGPMQFAVAEMLEDEAWTDAYLAANAKNLREAHGTLAAALTDAGVPVVRATAGMFVWIHLSSWMREQTWEEERRLWNACFDDPECRLVMTPGKDCKSAVPGCFRMCFAAVQREALLEAVRRLKGLLAKYE